MPGNLLSSLSLPVSVYHIDGIFFEKECDATIDLTTNVLTNPSDIYR